MGVVLIIAAVIAGVFLYSRNTKATSTPTNTASDFLFDTRVPDISVLPTNTGAQLGNQTPGGLASAQNMAQLEQAIKNQLGGSAQFISAQVNAGSATALATQRPNSDFVRSTVEGSGVLATIGKGDASTYTASDASRQVIGTGKQLLDAEYRADLQAATAALMKAGYDPLAIEAKYAPYIGIKSGQTCETPMPKDLCKALQDNPVIANYIRAEAGLDLKDKMQADINVPEYIKEAMRQNAINNVLGYAAVAGLDYRLDANGNLVGPTQDQIAARALVDKYGQAKAEALAGSGAANVLAAKWRELQSGDHSGGADPLNPDNQPGQDFADIGLDPRTHGFPDYVPPNNSSDRDSGGLTSAERDAASAFDSIHD